jgi:hypothetical protein
MNPRTRFLSVPAALTGETEGIFARLLNICGLRAGNIIFDLVLIAPDKLTVKDIEQAYDLRSGEADKAQQLLGKAQEQGLSGLEINPSYGAEHIVLFRAVATVAGHVLV